MSHLILIRHAQTQIDPTRSSHEWQLTPKGQRRSTLLAEQLRPYHITRLITSDEHKSIHTGALVAQQLGITSQPAPDLHETKRDTIPYYDVIADFHAAVAAAMHSPDDLLFGEETFTHARQRFAQAIDTLLAQYAADLETHQSVAVVTHGTVMSLYLAHISQQPVYPLWRSLGLPAYAVLSLPDLQLLHIVEHVE